MLKERGDAELMALLGRPVVIHKITDGDGTERILGDHEADHSMIVDQGPMHEIPDDVYFETDYDKKFNPELLALAALAVESNV